MKDLYQLEPSFQDGQASLAFFSAVFLLILSMLTLFLEHEVRNAGWANVSNIWGKNRCYSWLSDFLRASKTTMESL